MLKQDVLESLDACTTWQNYTCMYNATMYFKFVLAKKECMKSCQTVNYNVVERVQHMVPSKWVRFVTYNWHRLILFFLLNNITKRFFFTEWEDEKPIPEGVLR